MPCASAPTTVETDAAEAAGLKVYPLDHGGLIFDPTQPLPDCITVTIAERVKQAVADADGGATAELALSVKEAARSASRHSERTVVIIYGFIGATRENPIYLRYFGAREGGEDHGLGRASLSTSLDETIAKTQAWIAGQPDAASWDIVVAADA